MSGHCKRHLAYLFFQFSKTISSFFLKSERMIRETEHFECQKNAESNIQILFLIVAILMALATK